MLFDHLKLLGASANVVDPRLSPGLHLDVFGCGLVPASPAALPRDAVVPADDDHPETLHLLFYQAVSVAEIKSCLALWRAATGDAVRDPLGGGTGVPQIRGTVLLQVAFRPEASELSIRQALHDAHANIVGGPGALGLYVLRVPSADADAAIALLASRTAVVESVQRVK